jgi:hypothetical protein
MTTNPNPTVALRLADADEDDVVRYIAELDSASPPGGEVLLALVDGDPIAAMSLRDGHVVADPFVPTAGAVALLRIRAMHLAGGRTRRRRWHVPKLRPRFA